MIGILKPRNLRNELGVNIAHISSLKNQHSLFAEPLSHNFEFSDWVRKVTDHVTVVNHVKTFSGKSVRQGSRFAGQ